MHCLIQQLLELITYLCVFIYKCTHNCLKAAKLSNQTKPKYPTQIKSNQINGPKRKRNPKLTGYLCKRNYNRISKAKQSKAKQSKAKQSKAKQSKAKQSNGPKRKQNPKLTGYLCNVPPRKPDPLKHKYTSISNQFSALFPCNVLMFALNFLCSCRSCGNKV